MSAPTERPRDADFWESYPPLGLDRRLGTQLPEALRSVVNPRAAGFIAAIQRASRYANIKQSGAVSYSRRVLALGILEEGLANPGALSSSAWFARWAQGIQPDLGAMLEAQARDEAVLSALARAAMINLSETVEPVIARALDIAQRTVQRSVIDLRHFLFALTENPGRSFVNFSRPPTPGDLAQLREIIVRNLERSPEEAERVPEWRALLDEGESWPVEVSEELPAPSPQPEAVPKATTKVTERAKPRRKAKAKTGKAGPPLSAPVGSQAYLPTQTDNPAETDLLDREPFARVLSERIRRLRDPKGDNEKGAFMLNVHGRWGSGKSSVLNFLKTRLGQQEGPGRPARVIWFNAWEHASRKPPWWPFLSSVYEGVMNDRNRPLAKLTRAGLFARWWLWRARADLVPLLLIALVFGLAIYLIGSDPNSLDTGLKIVGAAITASVAIYAFGRSLTFGSLRGAQAYLDLKSDPMKRVVELFGSIVDEATRDADLVVIIDDLDRCDADFVVDLLEGIQNLFKRKPVTYVAAADRKWICTAFEKRYSDFCPRISEPARPLGYLFLEKMFQISAGMPKLTRELQGRYVDALTDRKGPVQPVSEEALQRAKAALAPAANEADIQATVRKFSSDPESARAIREEAAVKIATPAVQSDTENRLRPLLSLMEPNPRAMKRLVNEVSMAQARGIIEGRYVSPEARARWAMITQRWPQFAEYIVEQPEAISRWKPKAPGARPKGPFTPDDLPEALRPLISNAVLASTVGAPGDAGELDAKVLDELLR